MAGDAGCLQSVTAVYNASVAVSRLRLQLSIASREMKRWVLFLALLALTCPCIGQSVRAQPQSVPALRAATLDELAKIADQHAPPTSQRRRLEVIFVPGIMGSKLIDATSNQQFWGGANFASDLLELRADRRARAEPFSKFELTGLGIKFYEAPVYHEAFKQIEGSAFLGPNPLVIFPYDWRQSNRKSALALADFVCTRVSELAKSSIMFVAHSMGGLVVKEMIRAHFLGDFKCPDGRSLRDVLNIAEIIFVGTPHLGTPEALHTLGEEFSFNVKVIDRVLSAGLNKFGHWFEAPYELLPIDGSKSCIFPGKRDDVIRIDTGSGYMDRIDIFRAETWKRLSMPRLERVKGRENEYFDKFLPSRLAEAEKLLCDLANFEIHKVPGLRVIYFVGRGASQDTTAEILISARGEPEKREIKKVLGFGDATVAERFSNPRGIDRSYFRVAYSKKHQFLTEDPAVSHYINAAFEAFQLAQINTLRDKEPVRFASLIDSMTKARLLLAPPLSDWSVTGANTSLSAISEINSAVLAATGATVPDLYKIASTHANSEERERLYRAFIGTANPEANAIRWAWSVNNIANIALAAGNAEVAEFASQIGLEIATSTNSLTNSSVVQTLGSNNSAARNATGSLGKVEVLQGVGRRDPRCILLRC
ncbi:MAG: hypothetical protein Q8M31_03555 [Beijerinckiaceae bacterium]|nr:hypothetical protein [Beijerinckiaceae bacterium]